MSNVSLICWGSLELQGGSGSLPPPPPPIVIVYIMVSVIVAMVCIDIKVVMAYVVNWLKSEGFPLFNTSGTVWASQVVRLNNCQYASDL